MAAPAPPSTRQPPPVGLTLNLASNNPFRNRTGSPSPHTATSPPPPVIGSGNAPTSKNPFLDASEVPMTASPIQNELPAGMPADIFKNLSLLDKPNGAAAPPVKSRVPPRAGTMPIKADDRDRSARPPRGPDVPPKSEHPRRSRGMSESSVMEKDRQGRREHERGMRPPRTESEERKRRERYKEREEKHRREKERIRNGGKPAKHQRGLDIIDKLDVTGIYGQGLFHHDGPFDACNPHRNAKKDRRAPMQAFPADSANMQLGGSGPLRTHIDLDKFHGRGEEGFSEYAATRKTATTVIDPTARTDLVHGAETHGLGTSTFLEGAPASRTAMQKRDSDEEPTSPDGLGGGLSRKKSLAQRLRGMSASRYQRPGVRSPDARYLIPQDTLNTSPPRQGGKPVSAGGPLRANYTNENEVNPFDNDYEAAFDRKGAQIKVAELEKPAPGPSGSLGGVGRPPTSPKGAELARSVTADSAVHKSSNEEERPSVGGGFLSRMRSLKGGRRSRPERRDT